MELVSEIKTEKGKSLQLLKGDLTNIPDEHKVDILVVSAFPNDYLTTYTSLIGALYKKGLSVANLSKDKELDIRKYSYCWLSKEVDFPNIKRILCFEPTERNNPYSLIAGIFQSLMLTAKTHAIETIAMPLIMTGDQNYPEQPVIEELIKTSLLWLDISPFRTIKIVERKDYKLQLLKSSFDNKTIFYKRTLDIDKYDFFISYSRKNTDEVKLIKEKLASIFNIFIDTQSIDIGSNWMNAINTSLANSNRFIVCLSPDYIVSDICKYEYSFCNLKYIKNGADFVLPIYLYSTELPFEMSILNYFNAREGDKNKIIDFCEYLKRKYA